MARGWGWYCISLPVIRSVVGRDQVLEGLVRSLRLDGRSGGKVAGVGEGEGETEGSGPRSLAKVDPDD